MTFKSEADQLKSGVVALTVCIGQILAESDPEIPKRLESLLDDWEKKLADQGEPHASELVYMMRRALRDPGLFPSPVPQ